MGKSNISPPDLSSWWVQSEQVGETEQHRQLTWTKAEEDVEADHVIKTGSQDEKKRDGDGTALAWLIGFLRGKGDVYTYDIWPEAERKGITRKSLKQAVYNHRELFDVTPMGPKAMWKLL